MTNKRYLVYILINLIIITQGNGERTKDKMYEKIHGTAACFRRLNSTHQTGCTSKRTGSNGVIHIVNTPSDLEVILTKLKAGPYVPVMPVTLLNGDILDKIKQSPDKISGVIVHKNISKPEYFSGEPQCPNEGYGLKNQCVGKGWNPQGTAVLQGDYPFPIFLVQNEENLDKIVKCFKKFNDYDHENQEFRSLCSLEMTSFMFAAVNSQTCIRRANSWTTLTNARYCDPLGDRNVWSTLYPIKNETNRIKDVIFVVARMDTTSLFNEITPGAESSVTGFVTLMAIAELMQRMVKDRLKYKRNVVFVIFNGESYDYIGSQRLVYDIINDKFPMETDPDIKNNLPHIKMEDIKLIVELGQLSKGKLYAHYLQNPDTEKEITTFKSLLASHMAFNTSSLHLLPPSSLQSFLSHDPSIPGVYLADHSGEFANRYYNSIYDDAGNVGFEYVNSTLDGAQTAMEGTLQDWLGDVVGAVGRSLYEEVVGERFSGDVEKGKSVFYINELLNCYLFTSSCKIYKAIGMKEYTSDRPLGLYVGVVVSGNLQTVLTSRALAWLTGNVTDIPEKNCTGDPHNPVYQYLWLSNDLENVTAGRCYQTTMNYTLAISPAFEIKDYDWSSGNYSTWTESIWKDFSVRMYLKPSARHEVMTISIGTVILVLSMVFVYFVNSRSNILFPKPVESNTGAGTSC